MVEKNYFNSEEGFGIFDYKMERKKKPPANLIDLCKRKNQNAIKGKGYDYCC